MSQTESKEPSSIANPHGEDRFQERGFGDKGLKLYVAQMAAPWRFRVAMRWGTRVKGTLSGMGSLSSSGWLLALRARALSVQPGYSMSRLPMALGATSLSAVLSSLSPSSRRRHWGAGDCYEVYPHLSELFLSTLASRYLEIRATSG